MVGLAAEHLFVGRDAAIGWPRDDRLVSVVAWSWVVVVCVFGLSLGWCRVVGVVLFVGAVVSCCWCGAAAAFHWDT